MVLNLNKHIERESNVNKGKKEIIKIVIMAKPEKSKKNS